MDTEQVMRHFGYDARDRAGWRGNWPNDGTAIDRLEALPEVLRKFYKGNTRLRVTFDLDPDFQRALLQIWGLEPVTLSPDTDSRAEKQAK